MRPPRRESLDPTSGIRRSKQCALHDHELFVGDDWAQDHHDVELMDEAGQTLAKARLPEGVAGITRLHNMIGAQLGEDADEAEVAVALVAAGYTVYAVNPPQAARYRERHSVRRQERCGGCTHPGRHGPHRCGPAAASGGRQPAG